MPPLCLLWLQQAFLLAVPTEILHMSMSHAELALGSESPLHSLSLEWVSPTSVQHGPLLRAMLWATPSMLAVAFLCCGALSVCPSGHQKICKGVTSIHILAKYHGKRFNIKPGVPLNPAGNLARDR